MEISEIPISINPEYEKAVPKLSKNEFEELISSIKEKGLWDPIITNDKGVILDGHHRWRACKLLGIECQEKIL
jgi:ParB-like chromosome segregation protein Spo0J